MSLSFSQLNSSSPHSSSRSVVDNAYTRSLEAENDRLKTAKRVLEAGLSSAIRSSSPVSSFRHLDTSILSEASTLNGSILSSPLASYYQAKSCIEADATVYSLQAQLTSAETEAIRRRAETISAEKKADNLREAFEIKTAELIRTKDLLASSNKQVLELERLLAAAPGPLERQALETEVSRLRSLLESSRHAEARLREDNRDLNLEIAGLKRSLQESRAGHSAAAAIAAGVPRLHADIKLKEDQLVNTRVQLQDANTAVARLGRELDALRGELRSASAALTVGAAKERELATLENLYQDKVAETAELQTELAASVGRQRVLESDLHHTLVHHNLHHSLLHYSPYYCYY